jgi:hypothetical protein
MRLKDAFKLHNNAEVTIKKSGETVKVISTELKTIMKWSTLKNGSLLRYATDFIIVYVQSKQYGYIGLSHKEVK